MLINRKDAQRNPNQHATSTAIGADNLQDVQITGKQINGNKV